MQPHLPTDLLRTFIEVIEAGSMLRASERVCLTPSAVSLQIKRLEAYVGMPVFFRDKRRLSLTAAGESLIPFAREILALNDEAFGALLGERSAKPIRVGMVEDFALTLLAGSLRRFVSMNPHAPIQLRVCRSQELNELIAAGRLDIALHICLPSMETVVATRYVHWFGDEALLQRPVLPLALLETPCLFRTQALAALDSAGIDYEVTIETQSVSALHAAIMSGLGVSPRTTAFMRTGAEHMRLPSLPGLPAMGYGILQSTKTTQAAAALRAILLQALKEL